MVDSDNKVHFNIYPKFDSSRNINTLKLIIETVNGETYYFNKTINFVKEGEQGTNGLTHTMIIKQCDAAGKEIGNVKQPLIYNDLKKEYKNINNQLT